MSSLNSLSWIPSVGPGSSHEFILLDQFFSLFVSVRHAYIASCYVLEKISFDIGGQYKQSRALWDAWVSAPSSLQREAGTTS